MEQKDGSTLTPLGHVVAHRGRIDVRIFGGRRGCDACVVIRVQVDVPMPELDDIACCDTSNLLLWIGDDGAEEPVYCPREGLHKIWIPTHTAYKMAIAPGCPARFDHFGDVLMSNEPLQLDEILGRGHNYTHTPLWFLLSAASAFIRHDRLGLDPIYTIEPRHRAMLESPNPDPWQALVIVAKLVGSTRRLRTPHGSLEVVSHAPFSEEVGPLIEASLQRADVDGSPLKWALVFAGNEYYGVAFKLLREHFSREAALLLQEYTNHGTCPGPPPAWSVGSDGAPLLPDGLCSGLRLTHSIVNEMAQRWRREGAESRAAVERRDSIEFEVALSTDDEPLNEEMKG